MQSPKITSFWQYYDSKKVVKVFFMTLWSLSNILCSEALIGSALRTHYSTNNISLVKFASVRKPTSTWNDRIAVLGRDDVSKKQIQTTSTCLPMISSSTIAAASCLGLSTSIGYHFESNVVTLATASILSNFVMSGIVPTTHILYDACWTRFLPMSLAFTLLKPQRKTSPTSSSSSSSSDTNMNYDNNNNMFATSKVKETMKRVGLAFGVASVGSILGCIASFYLLPKSSSLSSSILAGCLCASFIGGTVNFFSTARFFCPTGSSHNEMTSLLTSMATADVLIMALYFTLLSFVSRSTKLTKLFFTDKLRNDQSDTQKNSNNERVVTTIELETDKKNSSLINSAVSGFKAILLSGVLVDLASRMETFVTRWTRLPGTACAIIAFGATFFRRWTKTDDSTEKVYSTLSDLGLHLLFAAIGATANIKTATLQHGPYTLAFGTLALGIHIVFTFFGSFLLNEWRSCQLTLEQIVIASNAAIGGPATAAAFASNIKACKEDDQSALVLAATFWGVTGYAMGTTIGVLLTKMLHT